MPTRRELVGGVAVAAGTGVVGTGVASQVCVDGLSASQPAADAWPMERYDATNVGANPDAGVPDDPAVAWSRSPVGPDPTAERLEPSVSLVAGPSAVYVAGDGLASLARADGTVDWRRSLVAETPALWDGTLYVGRNTDDGPRLIAVDAGDGTERWTTAVPAAGRHRIVADDLVLTCGPHVVAAVGADGRRHWRRSTGSIEGGSAVVDGSLYVAAARLRRFRRPTLLDRALGDRGGAAWETDYVGHTTAPVVLDDLALAVNRFHGGGNAAVAVAAADGTPRWSALPFPGNDPDYVRHGAPAAVGGVVVLPEEVVRAGAGADESRVVALDRDDGSVTWERPGLGSRVVAGAGDAVLVGTGREDGSGAVMALDAATGARRWSVALDAPVAALAPVDGAVFAATTDGQVVAIG